MDGGAARRATSVLSSPCWRSRVRSGRRTRSLSQYIVSLSAENRRFSPSPLGALLTLASVVVCLKLGFWQLDRAEEKRVLLAQAAAGQESTVPATSASASMLPRYQRVAVRGQYDSGRQILLDNMPSARGRAGYRVLTPLQTEEGGWLLVDRGWVALGAARAELPDVAVAGAARTVIGRVEELPAPGIRLSGAPQTYEGWPRVLNFPTHEQLERMLQRPLARRIVLLAPGEPDGYERVWEPRLGMEPARHVAYAVQWFAFAALAVVIYIVMSRKPVSNP